MRNRRNVRRRPSAKGLKCHRSYRVDEAARITGTSRATIRRWIKAGLPTVQGAWPFLILGSDLIHHIRRKPDRQTCELAECFCLKCRKPRRPAFAMADYLPMTDFGGNLRAMCEECGTLMYKRVALTALEALRAELDVKIMERQRHLEETA